MTTREFQQKKPLSILFTYFKPHRGLFILDLVCATVVALIDLAFPLVTRKSMYDLLPNQQYRTFFIVMGVMMAAFIVRALLYYVISYWGHTFGILVEADIRRDLFTHVQELDVSFFDHNRTGQLMSRLTSDLFEITELAHHGPEDLLISTLTIVGALAILFSIEWRLALVVACILPVFIAVIMSRRSKMTAASRGEAEDCRHQRRHRVVALRHPHGARLCQRGRGDRQIQRGERGIQGLQAQIPPRDGCVQRDDGIFYDAALRRRHHGGRLSHHARRDELH